VLRPAIGEFFGTFCIVFAGTGAIVVNDVYAGAITHVGIALTFGLIVMAMIPTLGDVSGAHLNPAVTVGFVVAGRFSASKVPLYVVSQVAGALAASGTLRLLFAGHETLGATLPAGSAVQSWVFEFLLTLILMVVILGVTTGAKETGILVAVTIGGVIAIEAMFAGPVCGASMNPARSLGPAIVSGHLEHLWIYLTAPVAGAISGVAVWNLMKPPEHADVV
jgi:MIP family channel proteins